MSIHGRSTLELRLVGWGQNNVIDESLSGQLLRLDPAFPRRVCNLTGKACRAARPELMTGMLWNYSPNHHWLSCRNTESHNLPPPFEPSSLEGSRCRSSVSSIVLWSGHFTNSNSYLVIVKRPLLRLPARHLKLEIFHGEAVDLAFV